MKNKKIGLMPLVVIIVLGLAVVALFIYGNILDQKRILLRSNISKLDEIVLRVVQNNSEVIGKISGYTTNANSLEKLEIEIAQKELSSSEEEFFKFIEMENEAEKVKNLKTTIIKLESFRVKIMELTDSGKAFESKALLMDEAYAQENEKFSKTLHDIDDAIRIKATATVNQYTVIQNSISTIRLGITISLVLLSMFLFVRIKKYTDEQQNLIKEVEDANATLEMKVEDRTRDAEEKAHELQVRMDELEKMSRELEDEAEERKILQEESEKNRLDAEGRAQFEESLSRLSYELSGNLAIEEACDIAISVVAGSVSINMGAIYIAEEDVLIKKASFSYPDGVKEKFLLGVGGVGQAAKQKKIVIIDDIPEGCTMLFGGGYIKPIQLIESPLMYNDIVVGVLEIAVARKLVHEELEWIEKASDVIAVSIFVINESEKLKAAFQQVEESQENVKMILNSTVEGIYGVNIEGKITFCNNAALEMLGYQNQEEIIGKHNHAIFHHSHPDGSHFDGAECQLLKSLTEGKTVEREEYFWKSDGTGLWVDVTSNPIIKNGIIEGAVVAFRDITEKKRLEEERSRERGLLEGLVNSLTGVIFYKDTNGNYLGCNHEFASIIGKTPKDIIGKNEYDIFPKEKADIFIQSDREVIEGEKTVRFEEWIEYSNGKRAMIDTVKSVLKSQDGKVIGVLGVGRDMTERKQMEEEIAKERAKLQEILDTSPVGVGLSVGGKIKMFNPALAEMLDVAIDKPMPDFYVNSGDRDRILSELKEKRVLRNFDLKMYDKNHNPRDLLATYIMTEYEGEPAVLGWLLDISERKQMEAEIEREKERLTKILETAPVGVGISVDGVMQFVNPKITELIGAKTGFGIGDRYVDIEQRKNVVEAIKEHGIIQNKEIQFWDTKGEKRDTLATYMKTDYNGKPGILGWIVDITERKRIEEESREAKLNLEIALTSAKMGTWKYRVKENILEADKNTKVLYGLENTELDGTMGQWFTYLHPDDIVSVAEIMKNTMENKIVDYKTSFRVKMPSGEIRYIMSVGKFNYSNEGEPIVASGVVWDITDIKEAEKKIEKINRLSDNALELTKAGFWEIDLNDQEWYTSSERAARIFGDPPSEGYRYKLFDHWAECVKAGDAAYAEKTFEIYNAAVEGKLPRYDAVYAYKRPIDGKIVWIHAIGEIERDANGKGLKMYGVTQDITAEKEAEFSLMENEERLSMAMKGGNLGLWDWQANPDKLYTNDIWAEMLGYTDSELDELYGRVAARWANLVWTEDMERAVDNFTKFVNGEITDYRIEMRMKTKSGEPKWILAVGGAVAYDKDGKVARMVGIHQDISERKASEIKLLESQENIKKVLESAPVGLAIVDLVNAKPVLVNNAICDLFDVAYEDGLTIDTRTIYMNADDRAIVFKEMQANGKMLNKEFLYKKVRSNEPFWASCSMLPINYMGKNAVIASYLDITESKKMQIELEKSKNIAEEATRAKSDFLANMSHEIRTPMNAIIGLNGLLEKTELTKKQFDYVVKVGNAAKNLLGIINDILDFSKIEAGKMDMEMINFNLEDVLDNISNVVGAKAFEKGLELVIALDSKVPANFIGDPLRLSQVLINLSNNAVKFTEKGEVVIKIKCNKVENGRAEIYFAVDDSGIGMTQEQLSKLFKAFSQADASTTRKYGGTGLGLTISKNIIGIMGGNIEVTSEYGKGSSFHFTLSLQIGKEQKEKKNIIPESIRELKVMVADDNDAAREVMAEYLESFGMHPILVSSGEEAVSEADETVDLILMDWKMTGINGIEAWKQIKEKLGEKLPRIMIVTAYGKEEVVKSANAEGIEEILMKPIAQSALFDTILQAFGEDIKREVKSGETCDYINLKEIRGAKILLVEDNEINQQVAKENLENEGFWVDIADNGEIAVNKIRENRYDIVLMDLQMPVLDGYAASREVRKDEKFKELPIIALSADAMSGTRERVTAAGMNDYITKPIDKKELFETLQKWIKPGKRETFIAVEEEFEEEESIDGLYKKLKSFNVKEALVRLSGNYRLYVEILRKFEKSNKTFIERVKELIENKDMVTAARELHTIKGVAANIGGGRIQRLALLLENELHDGKDITASDEFAELDVEIKRAISEIETLNKNAKSASGEVLEKEELITKLAELKELIDNYDTKADEVLSGIASTLNTMGYVDDTAKMEKLIKSYDFDSALEICDKIIGEIDRK